MPTIRIDISALDKEKKAELAAELTKAAHTVLPHISETAFTVYIHENSLDNIAVGGKLLSDRKK
ncbi:MAG: 4-oxalocrotonate tautomerase DmpI [bacterium]|jgi:4-oxalocrotonate tautomerase